jgi:chaperonin cofactor prefoldin
MFEAATLAGLQIRRRELENELASLSTKESMLIGDLQKLEEEIIAQLGEMIKAKKMALSGLEAQKSDLEKKLRELQGDMVETRKPEEPSAKVETAGEPVQQGPTEEATIIGIVEHNQQQIEEE